MRGGTLETLLGVIIGFVGAITAVIVEAILSDRRHEREQVRNPNAALLPSLHSARRLAIECRLLISTAEEEGSISPATAELIAKE